MDMKTNLCAFELAVEGIEFRYGSSAENAEKVKKELELAKLHVHINDGNYNKKMLERAIELSNDFKDDVTEFEEKLQELKSKGLKETGSRSRMEISDQIMAGIANKEAKVRENYIKAVSKLEVHMQEIGLKKGESGYDKVIMEAWIYDVREEMYAGDSKGRTLKEISDISKAKAPLSSEKKTGNSSRNRNRNVEVRGGRC